jgi:hypothetical protein
MPSRRFLPPWYFEDIGACFVVKDHAFIAYRESQLHRSP